MTILVQQLAQQLAAGVSVQDALRQWAKDRNDAHNEQRSRESDAAEMQAWSQQLDTIASQKNYARKITLANQILEHVGARKIHSCGMMVDSNMKMTGAQKLAFLEATGGEGEWENFPFDWREREPILPDVEMGEDAALVAQQEAMGKVKRNWWQL